MWMYDRVSLANLLIGAGFREPRLVGATESGIRGFADYCLYADPLGRAYKPDSLLMEPSAA